MNGEFCSATPSGAAASDEDLPGFGLKYDSGFRCTHLSGLAGPVGARSRPAQPSGSVPASADVASGPTPEE